MIVLAENSQDGKQSVKHDKRVQNLFQDPRLWCAGLIAIKSLFMNV